MTEQNITYNRTIKVRYGDKIDDIEYNKLAGKLADKGIYIVSRFNSVKRDEYGFKDVVHKSTCYEVSIDDKVIMTVDYKCDAEGICEGFEKLHPNISYNTINTTKTSKQWHTPDGFHLTFDIPLEGEVLNQNHWGENSVGYNEGDIIMYITFRNDYEGLTLLFDVNWEVDRIQREADIKNALVETPLKDMGIIQKIIESRLKLKQFGINTEDAEIDCLYEVITENKSECSPDIVKMFRDARNQKEEA